MMVYCVIFALIAYFIAEQLIRCVWYIGSATAIVIIFPQLIVIPYQWISSSRTKNSKRRQTGT
jgi:integral membrane sensor domain MASE1